MPAGGGREARSVNSLEGQKSRMRPKDRRVPGGKWGTPASLEP